MRQMINIDLAIQSVTGRAGSFFDKDIQENKSILIKQIEDKNILVIGGAGTIGSNFIKSILTIARPAKLIIVDISENGLTEIVRDLRSSVQYHIPDDLRTYPINYSDRVFEKLFLSESRFDVVANFAAHKHVRSEKDHYSIEAMIDNNVIKAKNLLDLLKIKPADHFFCVSTDKAANPVNIMGASKKLMEDMILAYSDHMKITTARFANVAFSNGSLPSGFIERLSKKQPLSCPSDVKRFFVSPLESGQICMMACLLGNSGDIFFPKLDPEKDLKPFTLIVQNLLGQLDMQIKECNSEEEAKLFATQLNSDSEFYPVYYFESDTSGEKPFEEFYTENEKPELYRFSTLGVVEAKKKKSLDEINNILEHLRKLFSNTNLNKQAIVDVLAKFVENFDHIEKGKGLDQKM